MSAIQGLASSLAGQWDAELRFGGGGPALLVSGGEASALPLTDAQRRAVAAELAEELGADRQAALRGGESVRLSGPDGAWELTLQGDPQDPRAVLRVGVAPSTRDRVTAVGAVSALPDVLRRTLQDAAQRGASDIHIGDGEPVLFRVRGELVPVESPAQGQPVRPLVEAMLGPAARRRLAEAGAVDFSFSIAGVGRFRGNAFAGLHGYSLAVRSLPEHIPSLADLRLPGSLKRMVEWKDGLVLVTGPTGAGKSATLAALVQHVASSRSAHVITLEDPIEFVHPRGKGLVRQREIGSHAPTFADGLRDALREDPDVILVGEMRDLDTIALAITAAETGHLVLSTLHANRAHLAVDRIVDAFPEARQAQIRVQLADVLRAVVTQRLLPSADGVGRLAALEVLISNHAVAHHIREQRAFQIPSIMQTHREEGMWVLERHLASLVAKGFVREDVARAHVAEPEVFETYLRS